MYMLSAYFMWMEYFSDAGPSVIPLSTPHNEPKLIRPRYFLIWTHLLESSSVPAPQFSWKNLFNSQHLFYLNINYKTWALYSGNTGDISCKTLKHSLHQT